MTDFVPNQVEDLPLTSGREDESRHGVNNRRNILNISRIIIWAWPVCMPACPVWTADRQRIGRRRVGAKVVAFQRSRIATSC